MPGDYQVPASARIQEGGVSDSALVARFEINLDAEAQMLPSMRIHDVPNQAHA